MFMMYLKIHLRYGIVLAVREYLPHCLRRCQEGFVLSACVESNCMGALLSKLAMPTERPEVSNGTLNES